jgi:protein gp37
MNHQRAPLAKILAHYSIAGIHPAALLVPMATEEEFQTMCSDVAQNGFLHAVRINNDNLLLDGGTRLQVAWALQLDPPIERIEPEDSLSYVLSENIVRRHLTAGQLAMLASEIANYPCGGDHKLIKSRYPTEHLVTTAQAARLTGSAVTTIVKARFTKEWAPAEATQVEAGTLPLDSAYHAARRKKLQAERIHKPEKTKPAAKTIQLSGILDKKLIEVPYPQPQPNHQFNRTNDAVDWAGWTWNPVTGCLHGCTYCYARELAYRDSYHASYPIQFAPLFHHERLNDPLNTVPGTNRPQDGRVFVCSMADLFGEWVPQKWIDAVLDATLEAPEWEYLFLTKFPQRYRRINLPPKAWFGASVDIQKRVKVTEKSMPLLDVAVRWLSVEPMLEPIKFNDLSWCDLVVIGAQSETMQPDGHVPAFAPKLEWVVDLIAQARSFDVPVYLKPNLLGELTGSKPGMQLPQEQPRRRKTPPI